MKGKVGNDKCFLYGVLGNLYRINGEAQKAINYLTYCLNKAAAEANHTREIITLIRLGEALKYDSNHKEALNHFNKALEMCKTNEIEEYLDFVLQHKGKCFMELAMLNEAEECFVKALELRESKGELSLIDSTLQAIGLVKEMQLLANSN